MLGLALKQIFILFITLVFIVAMVSFILKIYKSWEILSIDGSVDVRYACVSYNNTKIGLEEFETILYGFMTNQCDDMFFELREEVMEKDVKKIAGEINVVKIEECKLPKVNTNTLYLVLDDDRFNTGKIVNITKREIKNSDVLICEGV